jgi:hypothetical protein
LRARAGQAGRSLEDVFLSLVGEAGVATKAPADVAV